MSNRFVVTREKASKFEVTVDANKNPDYNRKWEQKFKWLRPSGKGSDHFYCKVCKKDNFGSLRHITLHCTSKAHMKALVNSSPEPSSASVYFVEKPQEAPKKPPMRKRRISDQSNDRSDSETMEISPSNTKPPPPKSELIHLKTYTCPSDGRKIVFNMERRLEPLKRADTSIRVKRQVVPPFTRTSETQAAVNAIQQAEAGLLIEEEPAEPFAASPVHPIIKSERVTPKNPSPNTPSRVVIDQRVDEDTFDVFSRHVANKLRSLSVEQNRFAQKLIMDVLFEGEMESLDRNTKILKCGVSCVCQH